MADAAGIGTVLDGNGTAHIAHSPETAGVACLIRAWLGKTAVLKPKQPKVFWGVGITETEGLRKEGGFSKQLIGITMLVLILIIAFYFLGTGREGTQATGNNVTPPLDGKPPLFTFNRTVQVTPDGEYLTGSFPRIGYVPATDRFVVTFGTKRSVEKGACNGSGYVYKEYTAGMQETGKSGDLIRYNDFQCEAGDSGSVMDGNDYYLATVPQGPGYPYGWRLTKFSAIDWTILADINVSLDDPHEANTDPSVAFVNGQLDVSNQYNPDGMWQQGDGSHHNFFSADLTPMDKKYLTDSPHISGASMTYVDGIYYIISADSYPGDLVVLKYDRDWKYLGMKELIKQAHWSQGVVFDGRNFYVAYLNTSIRNESGFFPVYPNAHLAAFDKDWNLLEDVAVTNFTRSDNKKAGRPWVVLHDNRLYVSYDVDTVVPGTEEERAEWQAYVSIYDLMQTKQAP
jgi:hypothetical protein